MIEQTERSRSSGAASDQPINPLMATGAMPFDYWSETMTAAAIAVGTLFLLVVTLGDYGMAWDEGYTVQREERVQGWFHLAISGRPGTASAWDRETIHRSWPFSREEPDGHPPFYALLGLAGWLVMHSLLPPLEAYRFGPAALFALTVGAMYWIMARHYGRLAGVAAAFGLLTMPRTFADAHLASYDIPTLCLWFLSIAAFLMAVEEPSPQSHGSRTQRWGWPIGFGIAAGCAATTKFTGWFLPVPLLAWTALYRDRRAVRTLLIGGAVAVVLMYALNPPWWHDPIRGVMVFLRSNLTRSQTRPVPTWFFGRFYPFSLPWYNTLVWTGVVVPPATLALGLLGIGRVLWGRLRDRAGTLLLICWCFFMVLRALPNAPGHDGVRQFEAAFAFLACLAGVGASGLPMIFRRLGGRGRVVDSPDRRAPGGGKARHSTEARLSTPHGHSDRPLIPMLLATTTLLGVLLAGAWSTWLYHPLQLSYYNILIGGLSGATRAGMEPTYYWDAVTPDVRRWINTHTAQGRTVRFTNVIPTFEYLHRWGLLKPSPLPDPRRRPQWYITQNRPGELHEPGLYLDRFLLEHGRPVFVKSLSVAPEVPLVAIYPFEDALAAALERSRSSGGETPDE